MNAPQKSQTGPYRESRYFEDVSVGEVLPEVAFPLSVYRLVMWAGAGRDFNSIHHNTEYAQGTGVPEMYANNGILQGMWERTVRDWSGPGAIFRALRKFRMRRFTFVAETPVVRAKVIETRPETGIVVIELETHDSKGITVGPGLIEIELPRRR